MPTTSNIDWFSVHYSEQLWYNLVDFYSPIRLCNFDTGWVLCHISVVFFLIPFKPQRSTPTMVTPPTGQISSCDLPCRRDRPSTFLNTKINHNSVNFNCIQTKIVKEMCLNELFTCTKFQRDRSMHSQVMVKNAKCVKRLKKKEIILKLCSLISWDWLAQLTSNLVCRFA